MLETAAKVQMNSLSPTLMVDNLPHTIQYYQDKLGFEPVMYYPDPERAIMAIIQRDNIEIMLETRDSFATLFPSHQERQLGGSFAFYIRVHNVNALHESLYQQAVDIIQPLEDTTYGMREFSIKDCNGYILSFGEAINR